MLPQPVGFIATTSCYFAPLKNGFLSPFMGYRNPTSSLLELQLDIDDVISHLKAASIGSRSLDLEIAQMIGWQRALEPVTDQITGDIRTKTLWLIPKTGDPGRVPAYTMSIDAAYDLAQVLAPSNVGGCSWEDGMGSAKIGMNGAYAQAATPAIALCIAALLLHKTA